MLVEHLVRIAVVTALAVSAIAAPSKAYAQTAVRSKSGASPECLILGDSIALGTAKYASCTVAAINGISSKQWARRFSQTIEPVAYTFEVVLISLSSNDGTAFDPRTLEHLQIVRNAVAQAKRVIWIAPGGQFPARGQVLDIAMTHGDVVYERPVENLESDHVHFSSAGYQRIARVLSKF